MQLKKFVSLTALLITLAFLASGVGATDSGSLWSYLFGDLEPQQREVLSAIRLPRIATAVLAGFLIGIAGAAMQRAFANQLAEPTLLGTTAAAAFGTVVAVLLGVASTNVWLTLPIAFFAALLVSTLTIGFAANGFDGTRQLRGSNLIIVGIALAALLNAAIAVIAALSGNQEIRAVSFWSSGTLSFARADTVLVLLIIALVIMVLIPYLSKKLDLFVFDEVTLTLLGHSPKKLKLMALTVTSAAVAATVISIGAVAFLGLAAPFIARFIFGQSMRTTLFASGLIGATILLLSDTLARTIAAPNELPISVVTSLIGAPFLLILVLRNKEVRNA